MFIKIYKSILTVAEPLLLYNLNKRVKRGKEDSERLSERFGIAKIARGNKPIIWFHAASVGESIALLPLISRIKDDYENVQLMITTGTVSSAEMMKTRLPQGVIHQYITVDNPKWVNNFLNHWQPNLVIWTESELWPSMLSSIKERKIPLLLLNVRMSKNSFNKWKYFKPVIKEILSAFDLCLGPKSEVEKIQKLGAEKVKVTDNIKYCTKAQPYREAMLEELKTAIGNRKFILWSSTHEGEEEIAIEVHKALDKEFDDFLSIILPRHATRKEQLTKLLDSSGLKFKFRSDLKLPSIEDDIYVADTMGETGLFYKLSDICIMGGTFCDTGGHNIIEPAHYACKLFYGPEMFNFINICEDFHARKASHQVQNKEQLIEVLIQALKNESDEFDKMAIEAQKLAKEKANIIDDILKDISPFIDEVVKA